MTQGAASPPRVHFHQFDGPLDLLLDEVRRQKVAIEDVAMSPIVARFLDYIGEAAGRNLNLDIEWLHMAAILIDWKSRSLLPRDPATLPDRDPIRDDLIRQLLAHSRQAAQEMARRRAIEEARFSRGRGPGGPEADSEANALPVSVSVWELIQQARELARWTEQERQNSLQIPDIEQDDATVAEMVEYLRAQLTAKNEIEALRLLSDQASTSRRCCLFLGMLEMAHDQQIEIEQDHAFGPIRLTREARHFGSCDKQLFPNCPQ